MDWRKYFRLSYAETQDFSERRSIVGILLIVLMCLTAGIISLYANGNLRTCIPTYKSSFSEAQVADDKAGCQGATLTVGQLIFGYSFTYVVSQGMDMYRDEVLICSITRRSATINVLSFAAPQFLWDYEISCSRPPTCCPKDIRKTTAKSTSCFCDQTLSLRIQDFSVNSSIGGSGLLNSGAAATAISNYTTLNGTFSGIKLKTCPDGNPITVLRFDDTTYSAFSSSQICSGVDKASVASFQDPTIASAMEELRDSIDESISADLSIPFNDFKIPGINYLCYSCSRNHDIGQLLLNFVIAISAIGSVAYSFVLWVLKATQRKESHGNTIQLGSF